MTAEKYHPLDSLYTHISVCDSSNEVFLCIHNKYMPNRLIGFFLYRNWPLLSSNEKHTLCFFPRTDSSCL